MRALNTLPLEYFLFGLLGILTLLVIVFGYFLYDLRRKISLLFGKKTPGSEGEVVSFLLERVDMLEQELARVKPRIETLEGIGQIAFQKVGFVRFNPFQDTGGDQSFALALLDQEDNGFVISSLYGREGTRVYAKAIERGVPKQAISEEEKAVLEHAITGN
jgi:hypothetical protein